MFGISLRSVKEQVTAGVLVLLIAAAASYLAKTAAHWVQWTLWGFVLATVALLLSIVTAAVIAHWRGLVPASAWQPIAWLPNRDLDLPVNPTDPWHTVWWPDTRQHSRLARIETTFVHAPPGASADLFAACGVEVECSRGNALIVYASRDGQVIVYEADLSGPKDVVRRSVGSGGWISVSLAKQGDVYSVVVNGEMIWQSRPRHVRNSTGLDVELWPENSRARLRLSTNDPTARVIVGRFAIR